MSVLNRVFSIGVVGSLIALTPCISHGANGERARMGKQLARYSKYFTKSKKVILAGGARPYVHTTTFGAQAKLVLVGIRAGIGRATLVRKGMEYNTLFGSFGGGVGPQLGIGPEYKESFYFGRRGERGKEIVPTVGVSWGVNLLVKGWEAAGGTQRFGGQTFEPAIGIKFFGADVSLLPSFSKSGRKTPRLQRAEEGEALSTKAAEHLRAKRFTEARVTIDQLKILREKDVKERLHRLDFKSLDMKYGD